LAHPNHPPPCGGTRMRVRKASVVPTLELLECRITPTVLDPGHDLLALQAAALDPSNPWGLSEEQRAVVLHPDTTAAISWGQEFDPEIFDWQEYLHDDWDGVQDVWDEYDIQAVSQIAQADGGQAEGDALMPGWALLDESDTLIDASLPAAPAAPEGAVLKAVTEAQAGNFRARGLAQTTLAAALKKAASDAASRGVPGAVSGAAATAAEIKTAEAADTAKTAKRLSDMASLPAAGQAAAVKAFLKDFKK